VEEKIIQTKMKSTEGDLRYPTMIDEQLDLPELERRLDRRGAHRGTAAALRAISR
jgi:hypothetical protein